VAANSASCFSIGGAENATDLLDRVIQTKARLGADYKKIERVRDAGLETRAPSRGEPGEDDLGTTPTQKHRTCQKH